MLDVSGLASLGARLLSPAPLPGRAVGSRDSGSVLRPWAARLWRGERGGVVARPKKHQCYYIRRQIYAAEKRQCNVVSKKHRGLLKKA